MEEERRLCYVGITRARHRLIITYARRRWNFGQVTHTTRSRFLSEIGRDLVQEVGTTSGFSPHEANQSLSSKTPRVIDDDTLDALLDGEMDVRAFLDS